MWTLILFPCTVFLIIAESLAQSSANPCPDILRYKSNNGVVYGEIKIPYDGSKEMNLTVDMTILGIHKSVKTYLNLQTSPNEILSTGYLQYRISLPTTKRGLPTINQITFNNLIYCYQPRYIDFVNTTRIIRTLLLRMEPLLTPEPRNNNSVLHFLWTKQNPASQILSAYQNHLSHNSLPSSFAKNACGMANKGKEVFNVNGEETSENEFPWLVAVFHHDGMSYKYKCTGSLISSRHVITAASCIWSLKGPLNKENIFLVFGISDINHWAASEALTRTAQEISCHPNYMKASASYDIAIIKLSEKIIFKPSARPICLLKSSSNSTNATNLKGIVAGWRKSKVDSETKARKIKLATVLSRKCFSSHLLLNSTTSDVTLCAKNQDGLGSCNSDSGSPFMIKENGNWILAGVVTTSNKNKHDSCSFNQYVTLSNLAKVKNWISENMY